LTRKMQYDYTTFVLQNKELEMARKRAPGGGRKPIGPRVARAQLSLRMPDDLRTELEAAAATRGRSLTQEMLGRLRESLARERIDRQDPAMRALCFLFQDLAETIHARQPEIRRDFKWHRNPFMFRAFKLGVAKLLDALEPPGEIKPLGRAQHGASDNPFLKQMAEWFKTPESAATYAATLTLEHLSRPRRVTAEDESLMQKVVQRLVDSESAPGPVHRTMRDCRPRLPKAWSRSGSANTLRVLGRFQKESKQ
jgi:hypothetical protein